MYAAYQYHNRRLIRVNILLLCQDIAVNLFTFFIVVASTGLRRFLDGNQAFGKYIYNAHNIKTFYNVTNNLNRINQNKF